MPALRAPFAVLNCFIQAVHLILDVELAEIEWLEPILTVLNVSNCWHASSCEVPIICLKPGTYLGTVAHKERLTEIDFDSDRPISSHAY